MKCMVCGKELTGTQKKFCSKKCNNKYYRANNKEYFQEYKNNWEKENMERRKQEKEDYAKEHGFESLNKLTYLHQKIRDIKPKPELCPICHEKKDLQLASIDHTYTEDPKDYLWLCQSCHYWFDNFDSGEKEFDPYGMKQVRELHKRGEMESPDTYHPNDSKPERLCIRCEKEFIGGVHAYICGECADIMLNKADAEQELRQLNQFRDYEDWTEERKALIGEFLTQLKFDVDKEIWYISNEHHTEWEKKFGG